MCTEYCSLIGQKEKNHSISAADNIMEHPQVLFLLDLDAIQQILVVGAYELLFGQRKLNNLIICFMKDVWQ